MLNNAYIIEWQPLISMIKTEESSIGLSKTIHESSNAWLFWVSWPVFQINEDTFSMIRPEFTSILHFTFHLRWAVCIMFSECVYVAVHQTISDAI